MARVLAIHAHPDDVEILAGGTLALLAAQRHELPRSRNEAYQVMMGWLLSRTGKP